MKQVFKLELVTPNSYQLLQNVHSICAKSESGDFAALANHENFIMAMAPCIALVQIEGGPKESFFVSGGFIKIVSGLYSIMSELIISRDKIDEAFLTNCSQKEIIKKVLKIKE